MKYFIKKATTMLNGINEIIIVDNGRIFVVKWLWIDCCESSLRWWWCIEWECKRDRIIFKDEGNFKENNIELFIL